VRIESLRDLVSKETSSLSITPFLNREILNMRVALCNIVVCGFKQRNL